MTSAALVEFDRQGVFHIVDPACLQLVAGGSPTNTGMFNINDGCGRVPYENNLGCVRVNHACPGTGEVNNNLACITPDV